MIISPDSTLLVLTGIRVSAAYSADRRIYYNPFLDNTRIELQRTLFRDYVKPVFAGFLFRVVKYNKKKPESLNCFLLSGKFRADKNKSDTSSILLSDIHDEDTNLNEE